MRRLHLLHPQPFSLCFVGAALLPLPAGGITFFFSPVFHPPSLERVRAMTAALFTSKIIHTQVTFAHVELLAGLRGWAICGSNDSHCL